MKKPRSIFYFIFFIFQLGIFIFSIVIDDKKNDFDFLFGLHGFISYVKYITLLGLVLLIVDYTWTRIIAGAHAREIKQLRSEHNAIKAKLFDMQEANKEKEAENSVTITDEEPTQELENKNESTNE